MTAEIAIMNLQAIALAADSAVTVRMLDGTSKIFTQANKLFALSRVAPVGILTYGNASFMGIPWETVVKEYRRNLGTATFPHLRDYMDSFCHFVGREVALHVNPEVQEKFAFASARQILMEIETTIQNKVQEELLAMMTEDESITTAEIHSRSVGIQERVTSEVVERYSALTTGFKVVNSSKIERIRGRL